jgi:3-hydroxyisobutyrate dehydrogenase-like beta-hydroxyacid dehydrogenase
MLNNQQGEVVTASAVKRVGVVGLGHMGHAFAVNLLQDGYQVLAYDRDAQRATGLSGARAVAARERKLFVLAAGPHAALEKVRPLLQRLGQHLFVIGEDPGLANLMKLGANTLIATTLESMGEVLALLRKGGIGGRLAFDVLTNSLFDSRVHKSYGGKIVEGRFSPAGMAVPLATKDLRLALAEAEHTAVPMPAASLVHDRLVAMAARGWSDLDWSALGLQAEAEAGLGDGR